MEERDVTLFLQLESQIKDTSLALMIMKGFGDSKDKIILSTQCQFLMMIPVYFLAHMIFQISINLMQFEEIDTT